LLLLLNVRGVFGMVYFGIHFNRKYNWAVFCYRPEDSTKFSSAVVMCVCESSDKQYALPADSFARVRCCQLGFKWRVESLRSWRHVHDKLAVYGRARSWIGTRPWFSTPEMDVYQTTRV